MVRHALALLAIALLGGCATSGDLRRIVYVPFVGQPGPQAPPKAIAAFQNGAEPQWSSETYGLTLFGHPFDDDAIESFQRLRAMLPGKGDEQPPDPAEIIAKLEGEPYFDPALPKRTGLPARVIFEYYGVRDYDLDAIRDEELRAIRAEQKHGMKDSLLEVGWRRIPVEQLGDYYQRSGSLEAYRYWQQGLKPNPGAWIMLGSGVAGAVAGIAVMGNLANQYTSKNGGFDGIFVYMLAIPLGWTLGGVAGLLAGAPFAWAFWDSSGPKNQDLAKKEFNRYLRSKLDLSLVPQPGGAVIASQIHW